MTVLRVKERAVGKTVPLKAIGIYIYIYGIYRCPKSISEGS